MNRRGGRTAVLALAAVVALIGCAGPRMEDPVRTSGQGQQPVAETTSEPTELGPTAGEEAVQFTVSLRLPGANELNEYLAGLTTPGSAFYRQYLRPAEFGARFGLPAEQIERIVAWLEDGGLAVATRPQRTSLAVTGRAEQVNRLLGVTLVDRLNAAGQRYHVPAGDPRVPDELRDDVAAILGLDTEPLIRPAFGGILAAGVGTEGLVPSTVARAYEIDPLHEAGLHGEGMAIAIVSFDTFTPEDVTRFDERLGFDGPAVEMVRLDGAAQEPGDGTGEVALDIQVIRGIAPEARIINYEGPNTADGFAAIMARIVADDLAQVVSISWGLCELHSSRDAMDAEQREFAAAFTAGISVFSSSGDDGAFDCRRVEVSADPFERDLSQSVDWPSSSPSVIGVGGTYLSLRQDGTYLHEAGWEEPLGGVGGGGGLSRIRERPAWQQGIGVDNAASNGMRQVPDVAGPADPSSGFYIIYTEPDEGVVGGRVGGTSAAAPFWAASMLLTQQLAQQSGITTLGPLGPLLYQVAAEQPAGAVFHDVLRGGNLHFSAGPGWDYSTGLGTPRVAPLAHAIVELLTQ